MIKIKIVSCLLFLYIIVSPQSSFPALEIQSPSFAFGELNLVFTPGSTALQTVVNQQDQQNSENPQNKEEEDENVSQLFHVPYSSIHFNFKDPALNFYQLYGLSDHSSSIFLLNKIIRRIDGKGNNMHHPQWGSAHIPLRRMSPNSYMDKYQSPNHYRMNPREISNILGKIQFPLKRDMNNITSMFTFWGQFLDHDLDLTEVSNEAMPIEVPMCDQFMDKDCKGIYQISFNRSIYERPNDDSPRSQINLNTAWIDGSQIYGSQQQTTKRLRSFKKGKLRVSENNLLPRIEGDRFMSFDAGDIRANENIILTSLHTIFLREHNRMCDVIDEMNPGSSDEELFQAAKNYVVGLLQKISLYDFLPLLIGKKAFFQIVGEYKLYEPSVNPNIANEFSTAAFRMGHSLILNKYPLINKYGEVEKELRLHEMFFRPSFLNETMMEKLVRGTSETIMKKRNPEMVNQLRNLLIPGPSDRVTNLDLFALNIQRAKDHGLPNYNEVRKSYGLKPVQKFQQMVDSQDLVAKLEQIYEVPENCDLWVGIISEKSLEGAVLGELGSAIVGSQFKNLRNGDNFWFQKTYPLSVVAEIFETGLSDIIMRNTNVIGLQENIFQYSASMR